MDKTNQKILTISFVAFSVIVGISISVLLKTLAGTFGFVARLHDLDVIKHGFPIFTGIVLFAFLQFNKGVLEWGSDVASEIRKVVWPSRKDTTAMTIVVLVMVLISSFIITTFDFVSGYFVNYLLR